MKITTFTTSTAYVDNTSQATTRDTTFDTTTSFEGTTTLVTTQLCR